MNKDKIIYMNLDAPERVEIRMVPYNSLRGILLRSQAWFSVISYKIKKKLEKI